VIIKEDDRPQKAAGTALPSVEPFVTLHQAFAALGIGYWKAQRGARRRLFPTYRLLNGRILVRLSEVVAAIEASRRGGANV
jgi:hypothetical protein